MLFWLFVVIFVVGISLIILGNVLYKHYNDNHCLYKYKWYIESAGEWMSGISGAVLAVMLIILCCQHIGVNAQVEKNKEIYDALEYKVTSGSCRDELGLLSKEVIDEVQEWNKNVVYYQNIQNDFWVGIFYPNVFDQFEIIDYESYNTGK